ncbi:hypothetical protein ACFYUJ_12080 [Streptomyces sp. NPDC004520]|uniref:hypothetical protein n=1 Tax=Streptomyces sp. NPDC004520 TaxID=3364702 RepID=UPI0036AC6C39
MPWPSVIGSSGTLLVCDEHPLRGLAGSLRGPVVETALRLRHRGTPARLARVMEQQPGEALRA